MSRVAKTRFGFTVDGTREPRALSPTQGRDEVMPVLGGVDRVEAGATRLDRKTLFLVTIGYLAGIAIATYPFVFSFGSRLPGSLLDPLQHLWIVRWYKTCLLNWQSPVICRELQYPIGAPLGNFSPLHLQALLYLPLSFLFNDVTCFNLIWVTGILTTGLGTFLLIWQVLRDRGCAALGGMLAMLSGPEMIHARAHLELIFVGCFPLFLSLWLRFLDEPGKKRLAAATAGYLLVALCAAYYAVFAAVPAVLYVFWKGVGALHRRDWGWLGNRAAWLLAFAMLAVPGLLLVFGCQLWALVNGYSTSRPMSEFQRYGAPLWTYVIPSSLHRLSALLPTDYYYASGMRWDVGEKISYLGVVTIALVLYAGVRPIRFRDAGFWWLALTVLVILSLGASWQVGTLEIPLPASWLKTHVIAFKMIRVPARFNLFVAVVASLVAAAGLKDLLSQVKRCWPRLVIVVIAAALALFDLSTNPFPAREIPRLPAAYDFMKRLDPRASFVEIPQASSGGSSLYSLCGYWQSQHHLRTNAGYSGQGNLLFDNLLTYNSPFYYRTLCDRSYASDPRSASIDILRRVDLLDYIWLYLNVHQFRFVVLHEWPGSDEQTPVYLDRVKALLAGAKVFEEPGIIVYDRERLHPPRRAVLLTNQGWRIGWHNDRIRVVGRMAKFSLYNPAPDQPVKLVFSAAAFPRARNVRLLSGGVELARWNVARGPQQLYLSPPLTLPTGLQELILESDGETQPLHARQRPVDWDDLPYSLRIYGLALIEASPEAPPAPQIATRPVTTSEAKGTRR